MGMTQSRFEELLKANKDQRQELASKLEELSALLRQDEHEWEEVKRQYDALKTWLSERRINSQVVNECRSFLQRAAVSRADSHRDR